MFDVFLKQKTRTIDKGAFHLSSTIVFIAIAFILIGHVYPGEIQAVLKRPLFKLPETEIDWWSVTHFGLFCILAYIFPDHLFELLVIGVIWEIIEDALAPPHSKGLVQCTKVYGNSWSETFKVIWCDHIARESGYWYGKWDDIFANVLGMILGHYLRMNNYFN